METVVTIEFSKAKVNESKKVPIKLYLREVFNSTKCLIAQLQFNKLEI